MIIIKDKRLLRCIQCRAV